MKQVTGITVVCCIVSIASATMATEQRIDLGNVTGGTVSKALAVIDKKCTTCHSKDKIDVALSSGRDMKAIQKEMEIKGVKLNSNEQEVLGIFWQQSKPVSKK